MVVGRGAISTEDVVIASFLEGRPRRKAERLGGSWRGIEGRGRAGLGRSQLRKAHRLAELAERVGNLWDDGPYMVGSNELTEADSIPARQEGHL